MNKNYRTNKDQTDSIRHSERWGQCLNEKIGWRESLSTTCLTRYTFSYAQSTIWNQTASEAITYAFRENEFFAKIEKNRYLRYSHVQFLIY